MDADFEQHYQVVERAYGLGSALWDQLQSASDEHDPSMILGWLAVVSLLLGTSSFMGSSNRASRHLFERMLEGDVEATIASQAEQGL